MTAQVGNQIEPYGGQLVDLVVGAEERAELLAHARELPSIQISPRAACDLELMACGAFSPLDRFVTKADYERILGEMRLASGHLFPIPVTLPVAESEHLSLDSEVALRSANNEILAILTVEELYPRNINHEAQKVLGTNDARHPLVAEMQFWGDVNVSGKLRVLQTPVRYDFRELRLTPQQTREKLKALTRKNVVAFQTRNPLHRAHEEITKRAMEQLDAALLLHPTVGLTKPGDIDHYTRVRTYKVVAERYYDPDRIVLALLPLAMRFAGPREALWHALIRRNYGANHFIVGRDHASAGKDSNDQPFYEPYAAQDLVKQFAAEIEVGVVSFSEVAYSQETRRYNDKSAGDASLSGTEAREDYVKRGRPLPDWFARPEVAEILASVSQSASHRGVCVWFTGLSGAGKSTVAEILTTRLLEHGRRVTLLDGDVVRTNLSHGLGFSKADRDANIRRIGFVASEIVRHGGIAVCAAVSPYRAARNAIRAKLDPGQFVEVFVNTPLAVCEQRDSKGVYARARRGEITNVTGIDDPYEEPLNPELIVDGSSGAPDAQAQRILNYLTERQFVAKADFQNNEQRADELDRCANALAAPKIR